MPRVNYTRTDRIAQMSKQEQLIAQKRQQILEKQRTLQMAKQIAAEASKNNAGWVEKGFDLMFEIGRDSERFVLIRGKNQWRLM